VKPSPLRTYGCADYRDEMRLLAMKKRLAAMAPGDPERERVRDAVRALEQALAMD
jgi:hypothetical protein